MPHPGGHIATRLQAQARDVVVVGGGPAGLAAAFYLARAGRRVALLERAAGLGGKCARLGEVSNHPAFPGGVEGRVLARRLAAQARAWGVEFRAGRALDVRREGGELRVGLAEGCLRARAVVLASGTEFLPLGLPREELFRGRGLENAPFETARRWRGREVAVVGGGETAAHQALRLAEAGARVRLYVRGRTLKAVAPLREGVARHRRVELRPGMRVTALLGGERLEAVSLDGAGGARAERVAALFVLVGQRPSLPSLPRADAGVFIAGDAAGLPRQTAVAAASGLAQAMAAERYLEGP